MKYFHLFFCLLVISSCIQITTKKNKESEPLEMQKKGITLHVLGTVQDGGSPHIGCEKECCSLLFSKPDPTRKVVSLGLVNHTSNKTYIFEATPDLPSQLKTLRQIGGTDSDSPSGVFLTHAHIGHYSGLMFFGREALGAKNIPVFAMPKMGSFLKQNGPWDQLVTLKNISLSPLEDSREVQLSKELSVLPFLLPHRDEYSETVGYKIIGPDKTALFIPDINKWHVWKTHIEEEIKSVDFAFLDATFYSGEELNHRDISEIPHPFVIESMALFDTLPLVERNKVHFIHFNHTNPLLNESSEAYRKVISAGFNIAKYGQAFDL